MIEVPAVTVAGYTVGPVWFTRRPDKNFHQFMSQFMDRQVEGALGGSALRFFGVTVDYPKPSRSSSGRDLMGYGTATLPRRPDIPGRGDARGGLSLGNPGQCLPLRGTPLSPTETSLALVGSGLSPSGAIVALRRDGPLPSQGWPSPREGRSSPGNFRMPASTASVGVIKSGQNPFIHNFGINSTFIGVGAGNFSMTGSNMTGIGENALHSNTTGEGNTGLGVNALTRNTEGTCNTATGAQTLQANTKGNNNTAIGHYALFSNVSGNDNTASGVLALYYNAGSRNTASGDNALVNNITGDDNTANGVFALSSNKDGAGNTASGVLALASNIAGTFNTGIGAQADVSTGSLTNATAIGGRAVVNASNKIRLGDDAVTVIEGRVAYTFTSDKNEKENFRPVDGDQVVRKIRELNLGTWNYIGNDPQKFRHYGPVAQEFFAAFGHDEVGTSGTSTTINSGDEMGILMIAVQALEKRTEEVAAMKAQIAELREMIRAQATQPKSSHPQRRNRQSSELRSSKR